MTINLPELRNLSYRWELPRTIIDACDYHFLDRVNYPQLASEIKIDTKAEIFIRKHNINFKVVFQNGAEVKYAECMQRELKGEPPVHVTFWLSYRSMSYKWNGEVKTISIVLVQPARPKVRSGSQELKFFQGNKIDRAWIDDCDCHKKDTALRTYKAFSAADAIARAEAAKEDSDHE